jgi:hypothetical protein
MLGSAEKRQLRAHVCTLMNDVLVRHVIGEISLSAPTISRLSDIT